MGTQCIYLGVFSFIFRYAIQYSRRIPTSGKTHMVSQIDPSSPLSYFFSMCYMVFEARNFFFGYILIVVSWGMGEVGYIRLMTKQRMSSNEIKSN